jgi:flagellar M-ring protein FliF
LAELDNFMNNQNNTSSGLPRLFRNRIITIVVFVVIAGLGLIGFRYFSSDKVETTDSSASRAVSAESSQFNQVKEKKNKKVKYVQLFSQLTSDEVTKVLKEMSIAGFIFKTEQSGNNFKVFVDEDEERDVRNLLALKGLPGGLVKGYELLDESQTLGVTEFDKRVRFLRALSGELEKAIIQFDVIEDAKVQIVLPEQRLFTVVQPSVTSSILIRRTLGQDVSDDVVFSIIQLVANAVENLQVENVSVIDTQGIVLSEGIFERLIQRKEGTYREEKKTPEPIMVTSLEEAIGQPMIPQFDKIREWFDLKWEFEQNMVMKTMRHLMGVLPLGSYKVSVTSDLGPLDNGKILDIRRLSISVVVDNNSDEIELDQTMKRQIFSTVAGATGYEKGRDRIILTLADFDLLTEEEKTQIERLRRDEFRRLWVSRFFNYVLPVLVILMIIFSIIAYFRRRRTQKKEKEEVSIYSESKDQNEKNESDEITQRIEENVEKLRNIVKSEPDYLASIIESWLDEYEESSESYVNNEGNVFDDFGADDNLFDSDADIFSGDDDIIENNSEDTVFSEERV